MQEWLKTGCFKGLTIVSPVQRGHMTLGCVPSLVCPRIFFLQVLRVPYAHSGTSLGYFCCCF